MKSANPSDRSRLTFTGLGLLLGGIGFLCGNIVSATAATNGIDTISPGEPSFPDQYLVSVDSNTPTVSFTETGINPLDTFDGIRDISLDVNGGTGAFSSKLNNDPFLSLQNDANTSAILTLDYGAQGNLNRDFLFGGRFNAIGIEVGQVGSGPNGMDPGSGTFSLTLRSGSTVGTSTNPIDFSSSGDSFFLYQDPGFAGIDFAHIDEVILTLITTTPGTTFQIESIYRCATIPEPGSNTLLVIGLVGLGLTLRRRLLVAA